MACRTPRRVRGLKYLASPYKAASGGVAPCWPLQPDCHLSKGEPNMIYDAVIVGAGPAGVSAALNLKIHERNFIWLGSKTLSEKMGQAERIANYPGLPGITGPALNAAFLRHIQEMDIPITDKMVNSILPMEQHYAILAGSEFYEAQAILLATGIVNTAALQGESELVGRGVSYCATCDGTLYRGRTIAIIITSSRFEHEVAYLAGLAEKVLLFARYKDCGIDLPNVTRIDAVPAAIEGEKRVEAVRCRDGSVHPVDGVFCLRESVALSTLLPGLATENGHIAVDRNMCTNLPGVYAAGDCTGRPYQYAKAVGEGNIAAHSILEYLAEKV